MCDDRKCYDRISNLVDISTMITESMDFFSIKDKVIEKMLKVIHPTKACINLFFDNSYEYSYLVCSDTLDFFSDSDFKATKMGKKIKFSDYPKNIRDAVFSKKIVQINNNLDNKVVIDEKTLQIKKTYEKRVIFPLVADDKIVGFITCFLENENSLEEQDIDFISSVASLMSLSVHITNKNKETHILIKKLRNSITTINEATKKLYYNKNINEFLDDLSKKACHLTKSREALIIIEDDLNNKKILSFYTKNNVSQSHIYPVFDFVKEKNKLYEFINSTKISQNIDSLIYHKLKQNNKDLGYIICANSKNYTVDDINVLSIFVKQLQVAIKLFEHNIKELNHKVLTNELELLNKQQKFLMDNGKKNDIDFYHKPAKVVGGDFYYCVEVDEKLIFIVADVMGHGIISNYVVAIIKGAFKVLSKTYDKSFEILQNLNSMLYDEFDKMGVFATCIVCVINKKTKKLEFSNAGHYSPIIIFDKKIVDDKKFKKGVPLGVIDDSIYLSNIFDLDKINSFWVYTDGVIEIKNEAKEEFGVNRFKNFILENDYKENNFIFDNFIKNIYDFSNKKTYEDDILIVRYKNWETLWYLF